MKKINKTTALIIAFLIFNFFAQEPLINLHFFRPLVIPTFSFSQVKKFNPLKSPLLKKLPLSDQLGIVKDTFLLKINDAAAPYNPSVLKHDDKIELVYREDVKLPQTKTLAYNTFIKKTFLDKNFEQLSLSEIVNTQTLTSEDPRLIEKGGEKFMIFNDLRDRKTSKTRIINLLKLDSQTALPQPLELGLNLYEKNWTPFVYNNSLHFIYKIFPHKILQFNDTDYSKLQFCESPFDLNDFSFWKWGEPRGGTPAIEFEDEYLTFFHSSFPYKNKIIYVMGAYTFEKKAPFKINKFSRYPILFNGIYSAPIINTADRNKTVIFPSGAYLSDDKKEIVLFCGENDSAIRVIKLDPKLLMFNLLQLK